MLDFLTDGGDEFESWEAAVGGVSPPYSEQIPYISIHECVHMHNVVYTVGGNSWIPCYVSIYSLLKNNPEDGFRIFVVSEEEKNERFFAELNFLHSIHQDFTIEYVNVDEKEYKNLPDPDSGREHLTVGVYIKLLIPDLLPIEDENVLYLDADTIIDGSLGELLNWDMSNCTIAAAPDTKNRGMQLGISPVKRYINGGVLYINISRWRENEVGEKSLEYIKRNNPDLNDQTALNVILHEADEIEVISPEYNVHKKWTKKFSDHTKSPDPIIIHYAGKSDSPWFAWTETEYKDLWINYCSETPFANFYPQDDPSVGEFKQAQKEIKKTVKNKIEKYPRIHSIASQIIRVTKVDKFLNKLHNDGLISALLGMPRYVLSDRVYRWKLRTGRYSIGGTKIRVRRDVPRDRISSVSQTLEISERAIAKNALRNDLPVIELGAGIGVVTAAVNSTIKDGLDHIAVEVDPEVVDILKDTCELNGLSVHILNKGYHPTKNTVSFQPDGGYVHTTTNTCNDGNSISAISMNNAYSLIGGEYFTLVADIEGAEQGFVQEWDLIESKCGAALIEFHESADDILELFENSRHFQQKANVGDVKYFENTTIDENETNS